MAKSITTSANDKDRMQIVISGKLINTFNSLTLIAYGFKGPGTYDNKNGSTVGFDGPPGGTTGNLKIVVDNSGKAGTVDSDLPNAQHVTGKWACAAVLP